MRAYENLNHRHSHLALPAALGAKSLEGAPMEIPALLASLLGLGVITAADLITPINVVFTGFAVLVVVLVGWIMSARGIVVVVAAAVLMEALQAALGSTAWVTVLIDAAALSVTAGFAHAAAANSLEARRSREHQLSILLDAARALNEAVDVTEVYERVIDAAARFVSHGDPRATLWQLASPRLRVVAERDVRGPVLLEHEPFPISSYLRSILDGSGARTVNVAQLDTKMRALLIEHGVRSMAMVPVRVEGRLFGALSASSRDELPFTAAQLGIVAGLADLAGIAIAKAREVQRQRDRARVLEVLREILVVTAAAGGMNDVAQHIVAETQSLLEADTVLLALRERERPGLWIRASTRPVALAALDSESLLGRVARSGAPAVVAGGELAADSPDAAVAGDGAHLAVAPVLSGESRLGVLAAALTGDRVSDEQLQLLALLASQLGAAIEAAELRGELIESERAFRSLCAGLGCAAVLHSATGQVVEANWAAENLTGIPVGQLLSGGAFGADWVLRNEAGTDIPLGMRPPHYVLKFDRPLVGLIAEVTPPAGRSGWMRIDSHPVLESGRLKWIVTTFYPVPAPRPPRRGPSSRRAARD